MGGRYCAKDCLSALKRDYSPWLIGYQPQRRGPTRHSEDRVKLLKTVRADPSDTFVFDKAAQPGEWAISGALMFAQLDPATLTGKARAAFRAGFLGIGSFGWSTLARIVEASEEDRAAAVELLAAQLVEHFGAPDLETARTAAEEEIAFAASLCDHPAGMLVAVSRQYENDVTREAFRTLQSNGRSKPAPVFTFLQVADEAESPPEQIDRTMLVQGERR
jgi:uncharacterized protein DUF6505